ncbi:hypothetical protein E4T49_06866 [Aureobasidium sp. EXF-10728]|nr:hypothetical protein E4T49_06866 [Aureobasidium sp. EXF-10728]
MAATARSGRLTLSDPSVKELAQASCAHERYDALPKLQGSDNWPEWSDALQHAALLAGTDAILNGESRHPISLEGKQCTLSEWNEHIKRTAVWRCRNESLLKAMRNASGSSVDLSEFGGLDARKTYLGLKSKYRISDCQRAFKLFSEDLMVVYEFDSSPRDIALQLQHVFNQYNDLVGHNVEQRLPENFLKLAFLDSLTTEYHDWRKTLLKDRNVLALDQGSTLTFNELVNLVIVEQTRLLKKKTTHHAPPVTSSQQPVKRNISEVDEPAQQEPHEYCSLHGSATHTNQTCRTLNPQLRPKDWRPSREDRWLLRQHPEMRNHHSSSGFVDELGSSLEGQCDNEIGAGPELPIDGRDETSAMDSHDTNGKQNREHPPQALTHNGSWEQRSAAHSAEVQAQIETVTRAVGVVAGKRFGKKRRRRAPPRGDLSGKWLLYDKSYVPGPAGFHEIELWETTSNKTKQNHPKSQQYSGRLTIGPRENPETFSIFRFSPNPKVTGRPLSIRFKRPDHNDIRGEMTFWGNGKMLAMVPAPCIDSSGTISSFRFAGIHSGPSSGLPHANGDTDMASGDESSDEGSDHDGSDHVERNDSDSSDDDEDIGHQEDHGSMARAGPEESYDRIIRADSLPGVNVKVEEDDSDVDMNAADYSTAAAIEADETDSGNSKDEWADDIATTIDTVQKQEDLVGQGLILPLHHIGGEWYFHSPKYNAGIAGGISLSFSTREDHDASEQVCAPGHCKPTSGQSKSQPRQSHYCGELLLKAEEGKPDFSCLIRQFDVPEQTSSNHVTILLFNRGNHDKICMHAWFFGNSTMRIELPTSMIPSYRGQDAWITFSGLKSGWPRGAR